jgi:mono/diheme cytochrome c family protein
VRRNIFHLSFDIFHLPFTHGAKLTNEKCQMRNGKWFFCSLCLCASAAFLFSGCAQQMGSQPHVRPLQESPVFANGQSARPIVPGTVPSGYTRINQRIETSPAFDPNADSLPFPLKEKILERGRERFNIYCSACHGETGDGNGMVVQRGFSKPPSYYEDRLRQAPLGHFYDVMTNGFGAMASYAVQVEPEDRWAIAAYIRTLQLSRHATIDDVPAEEKSELESGRSPR